MRVASWNVNGLRAVMQKGFLDWLNQCGADVVGLQETRVTLDQLEDARTTLQKAGWHLVLNPAERKGYSGTALLSRRPPDELKQSLGASEFDVEGRIQLARFGRLLVVNGYFPNGNGKDRDHSRIPYKLAFYRRLFEQLECARAAGEPILVMGDFNTAHREIDLARPKENQKTSGFTPVEREELDRWLKSGWLDTFRRFEPGPGHYSWWSSRFGVREKNIGWRIDLVLASPGIEPHLRGAFIEATVKGSDHAPIGVELDDSVLC